MKLPPYGLSTTLLAVYARCNQMFQYLARDHARGKIALRIVHNSLDHLRYRPLRRLLCLFAVHKAAKREIDQVRFMTRTPAFLFEERSCTR